MRKSEKQILRFVSDFRRLSILPSFFPGPGRNPIQVITIEGKKLGQGKQVESGNALTEYGLIIALVALLGGSAIVMLGDAVLETLASLNGSNAVAASSQLTAPPGGDVAVATPPSNSLSSVSGAGPLGLSTDPQTGALTVIFPDGSGVAPENATSVDGSQMNTIGSLRLGYTLEELASNTTDPAMQGYYLELARLSYFSGLIEAEIERNNDFMDGDASYPLTTAFNELLSYQQQIKTLMESPPPGATGTDYQTAMLLAGEVYNISQNYVGSMDAYQQNGELPADYQLNPSADGALAMAMGIDGQDMEELRKRAEIILNNNQVTEIGVTVTLNDAQQLDSMEQATTQP